MTDPRPRITALTLGVRDFAVSVRFYEALGFARKLRTTVPKRPQQTEWSGYSGYFADPDGHAWEVVHAPGFAFSADGGLVLSD